MRISVILCTYNRCQSLAKALTSLAASTLPLSVEVEVLVVDNNSYDQTSEVAQTYCRRFPGRFRYLFEPKQGKSHALNAGIRAADGDILAFTDDDVTVDPTWLQNLTISLHSDDWAGAAGRIRPARSFNPPRWLSLDELHALSPFALFDRGAEPGELDEAPFGANMAFRRGMFDKYGGFRIDLGPRPGSEIRSEDSEFGCRLLAGGERLRYEPTAVVYHEIPEYRLQKKYFLKWWFDKARADIRAFGKPDSTYRQLRGVPVVLFRRLAVWTLRWLIAVQPSRRFSCKLNVWKVVGQILECSRQSSCTSQAE
jgi:glycosyltransferase involved in cell wall biosynthesis